MLDDVMAHGVNVRRKRFYAMHWLVDLAASGTLCTRNTSASGIFAQAYAVTRLKKAMRQARRVMGGMSSAKRCVLTLVRTAKRIQQYPDAGQ